MVKRLSFFTMLTVLLAMLALSSMPLAGQTVPEPTNTPAATNTPPPPTNTPPPPAATNTPVAATETPAPGGSATATPTAATTGTPVEEPALTPGVDAVIPDDACASAPVFVVEQDVADIKAGPGRSYVTTATLDEDAVRTIIGRYAYGAWWLLRLNATTTGWIADADGVVIGRTDAVPLVPAPARTGGTPTPAASWNPTPNPDCANAPTTTPTATPTPLLVADSADSNAVRGGQDDEVVVVSESDASDDESASASATDASTPTPAEVAAADGGQASADTSEAMATQPSTPVPPAPDVVAETTPIWPLLIGIGLVGAAVVTFIVVRARGSETE